MHNCRDAVGGIANGTKWFSVRRREAAKCRNLMRINAQPIADIDVVLGDPAFCLVSLATTSCIRKNYNPQPLKICHTMRDRGQIFDLVREEIKVTCAWRY